MPKTALSLVIGIAAYPKNPLKNPVNDAIDISNALKKLGFVVRVLTDIDIFQLDEAIEKFIEDLTSYDVGLFYYAGHAVQIDGVNYLTAVNTNFDSETKFKRYSYNLNDLLEKMHHALNKTSILILDACRDNPYPAWYRSAQTSTLAPMYAPKGTLIAYSTSPGQRALDGKGRNGRYTEALLTHICDGNISIEELFKRVRNTLSATTQGKQTSWEHTSLTGSFYFNSHQFISTKPSLYDEKAIADKNFPLLGKTAGEDIIEGLKSHTWDIQNAAIKNLVKIDPLAESKETLFVLGRNILQAAHGCAFDAQDFIHDVPNRSKKFFVSNQNHLVNGVLFELYFDSTGKFRYKHFKSFGLENIFKLQYKTEFASCFEFIWERLAPFKDYLFLMPGKEPQTLSIDLLTDTFDTPTPHVVSVRFEGEEILRVEKESPFYMGTDILYCFYTFSELKSMIASQIVVPLSSITFTINHSTMDDSTKVKYPRSYILAKG